MYQELGLGSLQLQRWYRKLCCFYKICNKQAPGYLTKPIPTRNEAHQTRHLANIPSLSFKSIFLKNQIFPSAIVDWNKLDFSLRNSGSFNDFKNSVIKLIKPSPNKIFHSKKKTTLKKSVKLRKTPSVDKERDPVRWFAAGAMKHVEDLAVLMGKKLCGYNL